jgi:hypothetical protein
LRHRAKKIISGKHRRPSIAGLHDSDNTTVAHDWRQSQF